MKHYWKESEENINAYMFLKACQGHNKDDKYYTVGQLDDSNIHNYTQRDYKYYLINYDFIYYFFTLCRYMVGKYISAFKRLESEKIGWHIGKKLASDNRNQQKWITEMSIPIYGIIDFSQIRDLSVKDLLNQSTVYKEDIEGRKTAYIKIEVSERTIWIKASHLEPLKYFVEKSGIYCIWPEFYTKRPLYLRLMCSHYDTEMEFMVVEQQLEEGKIVPQTFW
jgi:hypothetical protein